MVFLSACGSHWKFYIQPRKAHRLIPSSRLQNLLTCIPLKAHILSLGCCHGCSWMGTCCICLRLLILEHSICAESLGGSSVTRLKSSRVTRVMCVALFWRTLTWSAGEGTSCYICFPQKAHALVLMEQYLSNNKYLSRDFNHASILAVLTLLTKVPGCQGCAWNKHLCTTCHSNMLGAVEGGGH